jgi:hypothetical protein
MVGTARADGAVKIAASSPTPWSMTFDNLLSKVIAAGLAAGVFLLWWPAHLPSAGVQWLVLRGVAWTLAFEVLVLSFAPLEQMAARALARRRAAAQARRVRGVLAAAPASARKGGAVLLACTGLLVPALLLAHADRPPAKPAARPVTVVRKVVVRRQVVRRETVVVRVPAAARPATPYTTPAPAAKPEKAAKPAPKREAEETVEPASEQAPPTSTTPPDPAALPDPAGPATAPAQDAAADPVAG